MKSHTVAHTDVTAAAGTRIASYLLVDYLERLGVEVIFGLCGHTNIALLDAKKGLKMFDKVGVPIVGIVENMSIHVCSNCGHAEHIFGEGGAEAMAREYNVPFLGGLPLDIRIREQADSGRPTVIADPDGKIAEIYRSIARKTAIFVAQKAADFSAKFPSIVVQNT